MGTSAGGAGHIWFGGDHTPFTSDPKATGELLIELKAREELAEFIQRLETTASRFVERRAQGRAAAGDRRQVQPGSPRHRWDKGIDTLAQHA
jgi:hypothetical protein